MAYIKFLDTERIEYLREHHTLGRRTEAVDTRLDLPFVSKLHAVIEWKSPHWLIRDMSQNGVWVNGKRLTPQLRQVLKENDLIEIAGSKGIRLEICDLSAPVDMAYRTDQKQTCIALGGAALLPSEESPEIGLFLCPDRMSWYSEKIDANYSANEFTGAAQHEHEQGPYLHGDLIRCADSDWTLFLVGQGDATTEFRSEQKHINNVMFRFDISQDEETTSLTLIEDHQEIDLGERSHHYLLVHLLRYRAAQESLNQAPSTSKNPQSFGWLNCHLAAQELGIEESYMNIQIFRARKQISDQLTDYIGSSHLVERRRGSIRVGIDSFEIYKEGVLES